MPKHGGKQAAIFARELPPEPTRQDKERQAENDRSHRHITRQDHGMKPRIDKIGKVESPGGASQVAAPEVFLHERIDQGKVNDEWNPAGSIQAKRLDMYGEVADNSKGRPEEI